MPAQIILADKLPASRDSDCLISYVALDSLYPCHTMRNFGGSIRFPPRRRGAAQRYHAFDSADVDIAGTDIVVGNHIRLHLGRDPGIIDVRARLFARIGAT